MVYVGGVEPEADGGGGGEVGRGVGVLDCGGVVGVGEEGEREGVVEDSIVDCCTG